MDPTSKVCYRQPFLQTPVQLDSETDKLLWDSINKSMHYEYKNIQHIFLDYSNIQDVFLGSLICSIDPYTYECIKKQIPEYSARILDVSHIDILAHFDYFTTIGSKKLEYQESIRKNLVQSPERILKVSPYTNWYSLLKSLNEHLPHNNNRLLVDNSKNSLTINTYPLPNVEAVQLFITKVLEPVTSFFPVKLFTYIPFDKFDQDHYFYNGEPKYDLYMVHTPYIFNSNQQVIDLIFKNLAFKQTYVTLPKMIFPETIEKFHNLKSELANSHFKSEELDTVFSLTKEIIQVVNYINGFHILPKYLYIRKLAS